MTGSAMRSLDRRCSEQQAAHCQRIKLAEGDINMSEQTRTSFMQELDRKRPSNPGHGRVAAQRAGVRWAASESFLRPKPGSTAAR